MRHVNQFLTVFCQIQGSNYLLTDLNNINQINVHPTEVPLGQLGVDKSVPSCCRPTNPTLRQISVLFCLIEWSKSAHLIMNKSYYSIQSLIEISSRFSKPRVFDGWRYVIFEISLTESQITAPRVLILVCSFIIRSEREVTRAAVNLAASSAIILWRSFILEHFKC